MNQCDGTLNPPNNHVIIIKRPSRERSSSFEYSNGSEVYIDGIKIACVDSFTVKYEKNEFVKVTLVFTPKQFDQIVDDYGNRIFL